MLAAIHPRLSIMDNGATKGASPTAWQTVQDHSGALWQLHTAEGPGAGNVRPEQIANLPGPDNGVSLEVIVHPDGAMEVLNPRLHTSVNYPSTAIPDSGQEHP